jgi:hypothetical protein
VVSFSTAAMKREIETALTYFLLTIEQPLKENQE